MSDFNSLIHLQNWEGLSKFQEDGWIFRGVRDPSWHLETSIERVCKKWGLRSEKVTRAEEDLIREFKRKIYHYTTQIPHKDDYIEWAALMQHYGAPTRLLDFTHSIYVAAYFALEESEKDCMIWAINCRWAWEETAEILKLSPNINNIELTPQEPMNERLEKKIGKTLFENKKKPFVFPINPFRMNERLTLQKGIFLWTGDITKSFEKNLMSLRNYKKNVKRILIPNKLRIKTLRELYNMTITRATLFPGIDGFARSLSVYPPIRIMQGPLLKF